MQIKDYKFENFTHKLIFGDCMDLMRSKPDGWYDLAIVDPPYGIGASRPSIKPITVKQKNGKQLYVASNRYTQKDWDLTKMSFEYFEELIRVSKNQIIWGENYYGIFAGGRIVWDKLNGESDQYGCEIAYCSINNRTDIVYYMWSGMFQGVYCSKDLRRGLKQQGNKQLNEHRIHPTQKPIALYKWILTNYAKPNDKILDTHGGSFSQAIAAYDFGFDLDIIEIDEDYYRSGKERYDKHVLKCEEIKSLGFAKTEIQTTYPTLF